MYANDLPIKLQILSKFENKSDPTESTVGMLRMVWFPFVALDWKHFFLKTRQPWHSDFSLIIFQTTGSSSLRSVGDVDHSADFKVCEDTRVHSLVLVPHIQTSCYDLHWIHLQLLQLLRLSRYKLIYNSSSLSQQLWIRYLDDIWSSYPILHIQD